MDNTVNKIQINGQVSLNAQNQVIERSILLNIREDNLARAVQMYNQLDAKINGNGNLLSALKTGDDNIPVIEQKEPKAYNWPFETNERAPQCPECGGNMVKRNGKNGEFWGCSNFRKGCRGTRQV